MTTIATDGKTIAADSQGTSNGTVTSMNQTKLFRHDGCVYGTSGPSADGLLYRKWVKDGRPDNDKPDLSDRFLSMVINRAGVFEEGSSLQQLKVDAPFAIGSGRDIAFGALHAGMTPKQAVQIACRLDTCTGGKVRTMKCP